MLVRAWRDWSVREPLRDDSRLRGLSGSVTKHRQQIKGESQECVAPVLSSGSTMRRGSALSPPRAAKTFSSTSRPSSRKVSVHWPKARRSSSTSCRVRRASRPRTSPSRNNAYRQQYTEKGGRWPSFSFSGRESFTGTRRLSDVVEIAHENEQAVVGLIARKARHELLVVAVDEKIERITRIGIGHLHVGVDHQQLPHPQRTAAIEHRVLLLGMRENELRQMASGIEDLHQLVVLDTRRDEVQLHFRRRQRAVRIEQQVVALGRDAAILRQREHLL